MQFSPPRTRVRRLAALATGGALVAAGLLAPTLAQAADGPDLSGFATQKVYLDDIQLHEEEGEVAGNYDEWHLGSDIAGQQVTVTNAGVLQLVAPASTGGHSVQLLKGYPSDNRPSNLSELVESGAAVETTGSKAAHFQIAFHWGPDGTPNLKWGTLYPANPTVGLNVAALDQEWVTTKAIGDGSVYGNNASAPLGDLIDALEDQPNFTISGFGVATDGGSNATTQVKAIWWDGVKYVFGKVKPADVSGFPTETVYQDDIQDHELAGEVLGNYDAWHLGSDLDDQAFNVTDQGVLQLVAPATTGGHSVQLLKGYPNDGHRPSNLMELVTSGAGVETTGAKAAHFQIAFHWGTDENPNLKWGTLYPAHPTVGTNIAELDQEWVTTKAIGEPQVYAANASAPLGDLIEALEAQDHFTVSGFGVATDGGSGATTQVKAIWWDGVKYVFAKTKPASATVTGTLAVGRTLTASHLEWVPGATYKYQWYRGSAAISGAKSQTYLVTSADLNQKLKVKVTATKAGSSSSTTSPATAKIAKGTIDVTGTLGISGTVAVGVQLTASRPTIDTQQDVVGNQSTVTTAYQWYRGSSKITGATKNAYTLTASDLGATISLHATLSKNGYTSVALTSAPTVDVAKGVLAVTAAPTLKSSVKGGAFVAGKKVTATSSGWTTNGTNAKSVTKRYFWFIYDASGPSTEPTIADLVSVTTSGSYTLPSWANGAGLSVAVYVVGTKSGYSGVQSDLSVAHAIN